LDLCLNLHFDGWPVFSCSPAAEQCDSGSSPGLSFGALPQRLDPKNTLHAKRLWMLGQLETKFLGQPAKDVITNRRRITIHRWHQYEKS
jgi:hypothetical protein